MYKPWENEETNPFGKFEKKSNWNLSESASDPKNDLTCTNKADIPIKEIKFKTKSLFLSFITFNMKKGNINKLPLPVKKAKKEYIKFKIYCFFAFNTNINPVVPQNWTLIRVSHISGELKNIGLIAKKIQVYFVLKRSYPISATIY